MNQRQNQATAENRNTRRIAFVQACWHKDIVDRCRISFTAEIAKYGYREGDIDFFEVPGSLEIPLHALLLAESGRYIAIVAAGFVVNGGIYRHEFVADAVIQGLMRVQLDTKVPVISAVLTPQNFHEHDEHKKFFHDHFLVKGAEAAAACAATVDKVRTCCRHPDAPDAIVRPGVRIGRLQPPPTGLCRPRRHRIDTAELKRLWHRLTSSGDPGDRQLA
jgi:6,7-dimethyl-8-ribityllumazine synthase